MRLTLVTDEPKKQCPTCGWPVQSIFDHVHIECDHDMTQKEIKELLDDAERRKNDGKEN